MNRRYEDAITSAERAVALGPGDAATQIAVGYIQLFAGNHNEAALAVYGRFPCRSCVLFK